MAEPYVIILAPNASLMTGAGTNTIILGSDDDGATVIDPADGRQEHLEAIMRAGASQGGIKRILITHGHPDHLGGAEALRKMLGVSIYAFSRQGVSCADEEIADGTEFPVGGDSLRAIYTPGHRFDHLCFLLEHQRILFAGDLLAGAGTVVIAPPDGDMLDYLHSLQQLQSLTLQEIVPAHGPIISDPQARLSMYIARRLQREQQILTVLQEQSQGRALPDIVQKIYLDINPRLYRAASLSVMAHLLKLEREERVVRVEGDSWTLIRK
jgi:glyoxylase-like metal-dependent hydrolase (beta-lactamase superfamily II)